MAIEVRGHLRFQYARDPLFLTCLLLYLLNRVLLREHIGSWGPVWFETFREYHLNDLLVIPVALPPLLWVYRRLGIRKGDTYPGLGDILFHAAWWSFICEIVGPHFGKGVGDWMDAVAYFVGGGIAWILWNG